jgi:hypothetical protein
MGSRGTLRSCLHLSSHCSDLRLLSVEIGGRVSDRVRTLVNNILSTVVEILVLIIESGDAEVMFVIGVGASRGLEA